MIYNSIRHADDTMQMTLSMTGSERKLQELEDKKVKENKTGQLTVKKTECIIDSKQDSLS